MFKKILELFTGKKAPVNDQITDAVTQKSEPNPANEINEAVKAAAQKPAVKKPRKKPAAKK